MKIKDKKKLDNVFLTAIFDSLLNNNYINKTQYNKLIAKVKGMLN